MLDAESWDVCIPDTEKQGESWCGEALGKASKHSRPNTETQ